MTDPYLAIERAVTRDVGRGSHEFLVHAAGNLRLAAESLTTTPSPQVVIVTGFYIAGAVPPAAETDGPIGAVQLAAALQELGADVRLLTDRPCEPVVGTAIEAAGLGVPLDVAPLPNEVGAARYTRWEQATLDRYAPVTHMIAVERPGPDAGGVPRTMRGEDMSEYTAPLERVYSAGPWSRIAIADGGNELGAGSLPRHAVSGAVPLGDLIHCVVGCDALVVGATSNWAAAGLVAALATAALATTAPGTTAGMDEFGQLLAPEWSRALLEAIVQRAGAVDGILRRRQSTVDGLAWAEYAEPLAELGRILRW